MPPQPERTPKSSFFGLLLLSAATLLLEVTLTRVLSVSLWYHFAFMVISTALFGLGFAGVVLALRKRPEEVSTRLLAAGALGMPIAFVLGYLLYNLVPFEPFSLGVDFAQWFYLPLCYLAVTLPFFFSGLTIAALLTRHARRIHRLYLFDLLGAGCGSGLVILALPALGGSGAVFAAASLAAAGAALVAREHNLRWTAAACAIGVALAIITPFSEGLLPVRISSNKVFGKVLADPQRNIFSTWNTISRIDVVKYYERGRERRSILIDAGTALTRLARPRSGLRSLAPGGGDEDFFYLMHSAARVLIVGSGGGREVLMALRNGAASVFAVEINPAINHVVREEMADFTGHLYSDSRVKAETDEARSYLRRSELEFDLIHCPHTISNAALSSGSLSLAENHLMTSEAFDDYLAHLSRDGVLLITRPEAHLPRLVTTVRAAFETHSIADLPRCIMIWRKPSQKLSFYGGLAVCREPFEAYEVQAFENTLRARGLEPLYLPGRVEKEPFAALLRAADPLGVELPYPAILEPATDDKPFFNRRVPFSEIGWSDLLGVFSRQRAGRMALEDRPVAEAALVVLLIQTLLVAGLFIVVPLFVFKRRALAGEGRLLTLLAFGALGLAYIVVEVGFIQRFSLYLGRPVIVFSTVLGTLLVLSGLGSGYARRFAAERAARRAALLAGGTALFMALLSPVLVSATLAWPTVARVALAIVLLAPLGFIMGMPFPLLVRRMERSCPERIPWAWGVNGFASVVGSIAAVVLGMTAGYTCVLLCGFACYLVAAAAASNSMTPNSSKNGP